MTQTNVPDIGVKYKNNCMSMYGKWDQHVILHPNIQKTPKPVVLTVRYSGKFSTSIPSLLTINNI